MWNSVLKLLWTELSGGQSHPDMAGARAIDDECRDGLSNSGASTCSDPNGLEHESMGGSMNADLQALISTSELHRMLEACKQDSSSSRTDRGARPSTISQQVRAIRFRTCPLPFTSPTGSHAAQGFARFRLPTQEVEAWLARHSGSRDPNSSGQNSSFHRPQTTSSSGKADSLEALTLSSLEQRVLELRSLAAVVHAQCGLLSISPRILPAPASHI